MTGITKDELMQMARLAGFIGTNGAREIASDAAIEAFLNAILERAAKRMDEAAESIDESRCEMLMRDADAYEDAYQKGAEAIRALKINTGD